MRGEVHIFRERVYAALRDVNTATSSSLARRLGVAEGRASGTVRRALDSLWDEGRVVLVRDPGRPAYWRIA